MSRKFKIFAAIADIHIGSKRVSAENLKEQLKEYFFSPIKKLPYLDGIFVLGDLMHSIVSLNSEYAELMQWFVDRVYREARRRKNCAVIILKGTLSHDNDQLKNIKHYQTNDDNVDFQIFEHPGIAEIWDDYRILVLPDVRVKSQKEIDKLLNDRYDMILGHGTTSDMQFFVQESEESPMKTIIYDSDKLMTRSRGPVLFGHIHQYQSRKQKFYYAGSFTLLERGVDNPGFLIGGIYDKDRSKFKVERYANEGSQRYFEWVITKKILSDYEVTELMAAIDELLDDVGPNDLITLRITRGDELSSADKVMMLENRYRLDKRFSIIKKIKTGKEEQQEKTLKEKKDKFGYAVDPNIQISKILYRYYSEQVLPTITDASSPLRNLTEEDIEEALKPN